jgi:ornithine carbamoyltransferase
MRHFLVDDDLSHTEQLAILDLADGLKAEPYQMHPYAGPRTVAVLFDKPSTRTRISFETAIAELGGNPMIIDAAASQLGRGESISDTARRARSQRRRRSCGVPQVNNGSRRWPLMRECR